jgi:hypothetical protein
MLLKIGRYLMTKYVIFTYLYTGHDGKRQPARKHGDNQGKHSLLPYLAIEDDMVSTVISSIYQSSSY